MNCSFVIRMGNNRDAINSNVVEMTQLEAQRAAKELAAQLRRIGFAGNVEVINDETAVTMVNVPIY